MKFFITIITLLVCISAGAQRIVSGTVTDVAGDVIIGVTVQIKGSERKTNTDFDGNYSIEINKDDIIIFKSIGYGQQEVFLLDNIKVVNITLEQSELIIFMASHKCVSATYQTTLSQGFNYNTTGIQFYTGSKALFNVLDANLSYATNLDRNDNLQLGVDKWFRLSTSFFMKTAVDFQHANFNSLQFHKYTIDALSNFNPFGKHIANIGLQMGYLNYDFSIQQGTALGYGITGNRYLDLVSVKSRPIILELRGSLVNWSKFVEKQAGAGLYYNSFSINGQYQWLGDYEEFTLSAGYCFYF